MFDHLEVQFLENLTLLLPNVVQSEDVHGFIAKKFTNNLSNKINYICICTSSALTPRLRWSIVVKREMCVKMKASYISTLTDGLERKISLIKTAETSLKKLRVLAGLSEQQNQGVNVGGQQNVTNRLVRTFS